MASFSSHGSEISESSEYLTVTQSKSTWKPRVPNKCDFTEGRLGAAAATSCGREQQS